jgi:hypothetical protein
MNLFLKPALDASGKPMLVRDPATMQPLAAEGEWKTNAPFWIRRMRDKEVIDETRSQSTPALSAPVAPAPIAAADPAPIAPAEPAAETLPDNPTKP